jgi:tungstate transport system substrate-binding protein
MRFDLLRATALSLALLLGACGSKETPRVRLATTTSARDTGLLDWVLPEVEKRHGVRVSVVAVGTGQALELARRGDVDLVIVHDRPREDAFVKEGYGIDRKDLMWNDFVVLGPADDPAGVRGSGTAAEAFQRLARAKGPFVSRGDDSGTHAREKSVWASVAALGRDAAAGSEPAVAGPPWEGYVEAGQGQGPTLLMADERKAYTLSDRATYASMKKQIQLVVLFEGDPVLRNPYGVMIVNPEKQPKANTKGARVVLDYLTSAEGQARIGAFRIDGQAIFHPGEAGR